MSYNAYRAFVICAVLGLAPLVTACSAPPSGGTGAVATHPSVAPSAPPPAAKPAVTLKLTEPVISADAIPSAPAKRPYKIGVTLMTRDDEFYKSLEQGLKDEAANQKVEVLVTSADKDLNKQINQVQNFVVQKVDAIVICPVDSQGIVSAVMAANAAGVPVFTADTASKGGAVACHVASDNVQGGRLAGQYVAKLLHGKGNVAILDFRTVTSVQDRVKGFKEALAASRGITIVADEDVADAKRENAVPKAMNILTAHPEINVIFGINDPIALGVLSALQQLKRTDIAVVGFDAVPEAQNYIAANSQLKADAIQYPHVIGATTIDAIVRKLNGETLVPVIPIPTGLIEASSFAK